MSRRSDDRLAARAVAALRIAAAEQRPATDPAKSAIAQFLAVGNAHVIVTRDVMADVYNQWCRVACEACGPLLRGEGLADADALDHAQKHAETCRRVPKRLWPNGGA